MTISRDSPQGRGSKRPHPQLGTSTDNFQSPKHSIRRPVAFSGAASIRERARLLDVLRLLDRMDDIFNLGHKVGPQATARSGFIQPLQPLCGSLQLCRKLTIRMNIVRHYRTQVNASPTSLPARAGWRRCRVRETSTRPIGSISAMKLSIFSDAPVISNTKALQTGVDDASTEGLRQPQRLDPVVALAAHLDHGELALDRRPGERHVDHAVHRDQPIELVLDLLDHHRRAAGDDGDAREVLLVLGLRHRKRVDIIAAAGNSPITRASTPGSLSTMTASVRVSIFSFTGAAG